MISFPTNPDAVHERMVKAIREEAECAAPWVGSGSIDPKILNVMACIPRHKFVPKGLAHAAYHNSPLPIGFGQTISQPYIVALMTDLLRLKEDFTVLEIGTGSGYQAAVLSHLVRKVYSIEIVESLANEARERLHGLGYKNVDVINGNGRLGLAEKAPFDAIMVTAAPDQIPPALIQQLAFGGRLVMPLGGPYHGQDLKLLQKDKSGKLSSRTVLPVAFVPLTGGGDNP